MLEALILLAIVVAIVPAAAFVYRRRQAALAQTKLLERKVRRRERAEAWDRMIEQNRAAQESGAS